MTVLDKVSVLAEQSKTQEDIHAQIKEAYVELCKKGSVGKKDVLAFVENYRDIQVDLEHQQQVNDAMRLFDAVRNAQHGEYKNLAHAAMRDANPQFMDHSDKTRRVKDPSFRMSLS